MEIENRKGIFFGIVAILTLIVAILGASFAYFTATASSPENAVNVKSDQIVISYTNGQTITGADYLIPASEEVAIKGYQNVSANGQCLDDNNKQVCGVYHFEIENGGNTAQNITASVLTNVNGFEAEHLRFIIYDVTATPTRITVGENNKFPIVNGTISLFGTAENGSALTQSVPASDDLGNGVKKYDVVLYLHEMGTEQDGDQNESFAGTVTISLAGIDEGRVTGVIE